MLANKPDLFFSNAVHEIRTPVQTIIGTLDLLSDTPLTPEQTEYVRQIRFGSSVLLNLVNDLLDYSKIKSEKIQIENIPFDIKTLVENVVHIISIECFNKKLEVVTDIDYSIPNMVMGDPNRIQQVLINLLKNAVKFTEEGYIHIELSVQDKKLLFQVTDSGIGVKEEKREQIFETFFQADAQISRKYGGTGLGLTICKGLVSSMNGEIGFNPNPYGGSKFWFTIPFNPTSEPEAKTFSLPVSATSKILIVDDSILAIKSLEHQLNTIGLQYIEHSTSATDALLMMQYAEQIGSPFDIVFIDMIMPVVEGWHLASEIKNNKALKNTKLYMLVPEGQMGRDAKMTILDWFAGYLYKPVRLDKLDSLLIETNSNIPSMKMIDRLQNENTLTEEQEKEKENQNVAKGLKILVTDDHPVNRSILVEFLKRYGAIVVEAENGEQAVQQYIDQNDIQIVFMDIQMPIMSGIDATIALRNQGFKGMIIACTANNDPANFNEYIKVGMNDILVKPFKRDNVKAIIEKWKTVITLPSAEQIANIDSTMVVATDLWDAEDFEDTVGHDTDLGKQILTDFIKQTKLFLKQSYPLIEKQDFEELHRIAHTLKGSAASISANKLASIANQMSQGTKDKSTEEIKKALKDFTEQFDLFILETQKWKHITEV